MMAHTQIWYTGVGLEQGLGRYFADGLNYSFVSSVAQAILHKFWTIRKHEIMSK